MNLFRALPLLAASLLACTDPVVTGPTSMRGADLDEENIPQEGVRGTLAGAEFVAVDAAFRIEHEKGRERVDLLFSDRPIARCGLPLARSARRVWLRWSGAARIEPGEYRGNPDARSNPSVHYEVPGAEGWTAITGGAFLLLLHRFDDAAASGALDIRFNDVRQDNGRGSAVTGRFEARPCVGELDRNLPREGPGLPPEPTRSEPAP